MYIHLVFVPKFDNRHGHAYFWYRWSKFFLIKFYLIQPIFFYRAEICYWTLLNEIQLYMKSNYILLHLKKNLFFYIAQYFFWLWKKKLEWFYFSGLFSVLFKWNEVECLNVNYLKLEFFCTKNSQHYSITSFEKMHLILSTFVRCVQDEPWSIFIQLK